MKRGCGLRRCEVGQLNVADIQQRENRWVIVDVYREGGYIRTVPVRHSPVQLDYESRAPGIAALCISNDGANRGLVLQ